VEREKEVTVLGSEAVAAEGAVTRD
jgi:hypothetical protein